MFLPADWKPWQRLAIFHFSIVCEVIWCGGWRDVKGFLNLHTKTEGPRSTTLATVVREFNVPRRRQGKTTLQVNTRAFQGASMQTKCVGVTRLRESAHNVWAVFPQQNVWRVPQPASGVALGVGRCGFREPNRHDIFWTAVAHAAKMCCQPGIVCLPIWISSRSTAWNQIPQWWGALASQASDTCDFIQKALE